MSLTSSSSCSTCSLPPASSTSALGAAPLRRRRRVNGVGAAAFLLGLLVGGAHAFVPAYHRKLAAAAPCAAANNKRRAGGMSGHQSVTMSVGWAGTRGEVPKEGGALTSSREMMCARGPLRGLAPWPTLLTLLALPLLLRCWTLSSLAGGRPRQPHRLRPRPAHPPHPRPSHALAGLGGSARATHHQPVPRLPARGGEYR